MSADDATGVRGLAFLLAEQAQRGEWNIPGQVAGSLVVFDDVSGLWIPLPPGTSGEVVTSNGPGFLPTYQPVSGFPGTLTRVLASGSASVANNANTTLVSIAQPLGVNERLLTFAPTPIPDAFGVNNMISENTNASPSLGTTHWMIQDDGAGGYGLQVRQNNSNTAARSYDYVVFGWTP